MKFLSATLLVAFSFAGCGGSEHPSPSERIVLVVIDTLRADSVFPHVPRRRTPNLARLLETAQVRCELAYQDLYYEKKSKTQGFDTDKCERPF